MILFKLFFVRFQASQPQSSALSGPAMYISALILLSMSLLSKKCFNAPMMDLAFLILVSISASSFRSGVIMEPKYLKNFTKWTFLLLGRFYLHLCLSGTF